MKHWPARDEWTPHGMCEIAAAIIGAGALGAGASIYGANKAAGAQTTAAENATQAQREMFNQAREVIAPYAEAGRSAVSPLMKLIDQNDPSSPYAALLKLTTPGSDMTSVLEQTPGFQFTSQYGQKAVQNALAKRGLAGPGGALSRGIADYTTGLAQNTWGNVVSNLINAIGTGTNPLLNLISTGAGAASSLGGAATQTGAQIGSNIIGAGNAQAGAYGAGANAVGNLGNSISSAAILNKLFGSSGGSGLYNLGNPGGTGGNLGWA